MGAHGKAWVAVAFGCQLWSLATAPDASAQGYPNRAIRMVVPFAPGGGTDTNACIVAQKLTEQLDVPVVVGNHPGAGSMLGTELVVRAAQDGYTLLNVSPELTINPSSPACCSRE